MEKEIWVECIESSCNNNITKGKIYKVIDINGNVYTIIDNFGLRFYSMIDRFKPVNKTPILTTIK